MGSNPILHFWYVILCTAGVQGSGSAEMLRQGEVVGVSHRVVCTWQLLGLAVKQPWLALSGLILALAA